MNRLLFVFLFMMASVWTSFASSPFDGASWISTSRDLQKDNQWICFRKEMVLQAKSKKVPMYIAVDSKYWLWVNGRLVIFEGELKRGPNPEDTYYDKVEIGPYLHAGRNVITVLVWYWGKEGFCHKSSGRSGLIACVQTKGKVIKTDASWKVKVHPAFGETSDPKPNFRLPESNVRFDARMDIGPWYRPDYPDKSWAQATEVGRYPCKPWNKLWPRPFPNWRDSGIVDYVRVDRQTKGDTTLVTGYLPRNISVTPYIKVKAKAGRCIDIFSDNYKVGSEYTVRAEYITKEGLQEFEVPCYSNGHRMIYSCPKGVEVIRTGYRETAFATRHLGAFRCSDEFYNKLWIKALNTMNLNMRDAIQDADRERSQWWGDAAIVLGEILYSCDDHGVEAIKKAIDNLVDWQKPDGTLYSPVPAGSWDRELPLQMLASIGKYGFWYYYNYTSDLATLHHAYPAIKRYLSLWKIGKDSLVEHRAGGWDWIDWGDNIDVPILDNAWYCLALESTARMARIMHDEGYACLCDSLRKTIQEAAHRHFWTGEYFRSSQYKGLTDDRANGMSILAGFSTSEEEARIRAFLKTRFAASPYMEKYILESYFTRGDIRGALERMKKRYQYMVDSPLTTLWEGWVTQDGSINHGWAGGPLTLLSQYVAGISPLGIGWKEILVHPQLGDLKWVDCIVPVHGKTLTMLAEKAGNLMEITLHNTTGRTCEVVVPDGATSLQVNGKAVSMSQLKLASVDFPETKRFRTLSLRGANSVVVMVLRP